MELKIEVFNDNPLNSNTYLIVNDLNECLIVDPSNNLKVLERYLENKSLKGILLTHGHYDHFKELEGLLKYVNEDTPVVLHKNALKKLLNPLYSCAKYFKSDLTIDLSNYHSLVIDNDKDIKLGNFNINILCLPGHTNCEVGYLIENNLFSGDMLFKNSVGRWDLPSGSYPSLSLSIEKLMKLDDQIIVYPGHDEDFMLKEAFKYNPYFRR